MRTAQVRKTAQALAALGETTFDRGRLDATRQFVAAASVRHWEGSSQRAHTRSGIVLATVHVRGEQQLAPVATTPEARRGSDARGLTRQVAV